MSDRGKTRVLVVDAEPVARMGMMQLINEQPSLTLCGDADSLPVARDWCQKEKPDVIVLDPAMGDGFGFIKELPRWSAATRVVVFTTLADALSVQRAFQAGACGYITRLDPIPSLLTAIIGAGKGERHIGPRVEHVVLNNLASGGLELNHDVEAMLSNREREVLRLLGNGQSTREVAHGLSVSVKTVETHSKRIKDKLKLTNFAALRKHATLYAVSNGQLSGKNVTSV